MRRSRILIMGVAAIGLITAAAAQAGKSTARQYVASKPVAADISVSAWKADQVWPEAVIDDHEHIDLILSSGSLTEETVALLARIAPAAGPEVIDPGQAIDALKRLSQDAVAVLKDGQLDRSHRISEFQRLMQRDFDIPLMARFALGRHWKRADSEQRAAYVEAFSAFLLHQYGSQIAGAKVAAFDVQSAQRAGKRDVMVQSRIVQGDGRILKLVWRMRQRNGQFRVIDVVAEGISLALTKRQEFAAIIKANGGKVAPLIIRLRDISA